jgi:hypothetical protein
MMDIEKLTDVELQEELKSRGIVLHHKTGTDKLREALATALIDKNEEIPNDVPSFDDSVKRLTVEEHEKKLTKEQRAMRLVRIVVTPNDNLMSTYPGLIFTVGSSSIRKGRMIKKYVPFNNEDGWHVPQVICDQIENAEMQKFKSVKMPNGEKQLQAYISKKFNVQILDPLTEHELKSLAAAQLSRGDA